MSSYEMDYDVVEAAYHGDLRKLNGLLEAGGDPNAEVYFGYGFYTYSALTEAYVNRHYGAMDLLLAKGAHPNSDFGYAETIAHGIARRDDLEALDILLNYEPDLDQRCQVYLPTQGTKQWAFHKEMTPRDMAEKLGFNDFVERIDRHKDLPVLPPLDTLDKQILFARNNRGDCLLDNPATWRQWEAVSQALADKGEVVSKADLLQANADGKTYLEKAVACNALPRVLAGLNAKGEYLRDGDVLTATGEPNDLLHKITGKLAAGELFTEENWAGAERGSLRRLYEALPDEAQQDVKNYHMLRVRLTTIPDGVGRRGRNDNVSPAAKSQAI